jgi:hypothetical protein
MVLGMLTHEKQEHWTQGQGVKVFLFVKGGTSNLDIIPDQNQNVTYPSQFEIVMNQICKWYSQNGICLDNFPHTPTTLVLVAIAICFLICNTENDVHFQCSSCHNKTDSSNQ